MDKLAFVKVAEVSGVIASLAENEIVKIASAEDFDAIVDAVAEDLPTQYGMDDVLAKTAEVMEYLYDNGYGEGLEKDAGEVDEQEALAYIGQLTLAKEAGEISEVDFAKEANRVVDALRAAGVRVKDGVAYIGGKAKAGYGKAKDGAAWAGNKAKAGYGKARSGAAAAAGKAKAGAGTAKRVLKDGFTAQSFRAAKGIKAKGKGALPILAAAGLTTAAGYGGYKGIKALANRGKE